MPAATSIPTAAESPLMDQTAEADPADPRQASLRAASGRPTLRAQVAENPLVSFLGAVIVALLVTMVTTTNIRINRLEDRVDRLEDKMEERFAAQDAKIDEVDLKLTAKIDEINLKLTALIAALNATDAVDDAIEGRLTDRSGDPAPDPATSGVS